MTGDLEWKHFMETKAQVRFIPFGQHRLRLVEVGAGEPLLMIHGFADSAYTWHRNLWALAQAGFRVLAYDHPGCGESILPSDFRFGVENMARLAVRLLDELNVGKAHLIGSSMGGGIGLYLAVHHPDRLRRVVLVAPTCHHAPLRPFISLFRCPPFAALARRLSGPWLARPILRSQYGDPALLTPPVLAQYRIAFERPEYLVACGRMLRDYWNRSFAATARRYQEIRLPLQLVWGERDIWVHPRRYALRLAAQTGAALTVIAEAGHLVHQARPQIFNETVIHFLAGR
ncbi:MAG: alpha/beta fold hydrolase [Anaerolineae bacterium]|jgi:pimeloyl-ACP methyl ester carboxylesterase